MRLLATVPDKKLAQRFSDYLLASQIPNRLVEESGSHWEVWVLDEEQMGRADSLWKEYLVNPEQPRYQAAHAQAQVFRLQQRHQESQASNIVDVRRQWHRYDRQIGPFTLALILTSILVTLITRMGRDPQLMAYLDITQAEMIGPYLRWQAGLPEIFRGQVWRLWTPIFVHLSILHLVFNMLWLKDLGTMIEKHQGTLWLALQVAVIGLASNLAQYYWSGPKFGGMSGVVYGLLGYIWIRERFDPWCGLSLNPGVVTMMIVWFFLCMTGWMGPIANAAHAGGLAAGMLWGFLAAKLSRRSPK